MISAKIAIEIIHWRCFMVVSLSRPLAMHVPSTDLSPDKLLSGARTRLDGASVRAGPYGRPSASLDAFTNFA
jgi:hypothetical protein